MSALRLFIMRHGPSEDSAPSGRDFDRQLSSGGRIRTLAVARDLRSRGEDVQRIVTSPLVRAVQTGELVHVVFESARVDVRGQLAPSEDARELVAELLSGPDESVLLVSHAPDVSLLAEHLIGQRVASFQAAAIVALELGRDGSGRVARRFTVDPSTQAP